MKNHVGVCFLDYPLQIIDIKKIDIYSLPIYNTTIQLNYIVELDSEI